MTKQNKILLGGLSAIAIAYLLTKKKTIFKNGTGTNNCPLGTSVQQCCVNNGGIWYNNTCNTGGTGTGTGESGTGVSNESGTGTGGTGTGGTGTGTGGTPTCTGGRTYNTLTQQCECPSGQTFNTTTQLCETSGTGGSGSGTGTGGSGTGTGGTGTGGTGTGGVAGDVYTGTLIQSCPSGYVYDSRLARCVLAIFNTGISLNANTICPTGYTYDLAQKKCVLVIQSTNCPSGQTYNAVTSACEPDGTGDGSGGSGGGYGGGGGGGSADSGDAAATEEKKFDWVPYILAGMVTALSVVSEK